jgi:hypothetical protein
VQTLTLDKLTACLRVGARGAYATEAAVELLIAHGTWLRRADFRAACVDDDGHTLAWIEWDTVVDFLNDAPASTSEESMLLIAAELIGVDTGTPLGHLLTGLDAHNTRIVLDAIAHACALHVRGGDRR